VNSSDLTITLNIAEILALGGVVWGLARMSKSLDFLSDATSDLGKRMEYFGMTLNDMVGRVRVLEDRGNRS
jgi:hypothetical protein